MTKFLRIAVIVATLGLCNATFAEQSGGFLGLEAGYSTISVSFNNNMYDDTLSLRGELKGGGVDVGVVGGYKQFFSPYIGLRYYGSVNVVLAKVKPKLIEVDAMLGKTMRGGMGTRSAMLINYAFNIDILANFVIREKNRIADFGAFFGVGIGGNHWRGKGLDEIDDYIDTMNNAFQVGWDKKTQRNFFDLSLNVGLRTNIDYNHGLELALKMPLIENTFIDETKRNANNPQSVASLDFHTKVPIYNITLRYTYSFGSPKKVVRKSIKKSTGQSQILE